MFGEFFAKATSMSYDLTTLTQNYTVSKIKKIAVQYINIYWIQLYKSCETPIQKVLTRHIESVHSALI